MLKLKKITGAAAAGSRGALLGLAQGLEQAGAGCGRWKRLWALAGWKEGAG